MTIQAIQTYYKGYKFRSRLEARWAVFLDGLRYTDWQYEKEGFVLDGGIPYLPDFWIDFDPKQFPGHGTHVEIKPYAPTQEERLRLALLHKGTGNSVVCFWGFPDPAELHATVYTNGKCFIDDAIYEDEYQCLAGISSDRVFPMPFGYYWLITPDVAKRGLIKSASNAAKAARFEHGERG